MFRFGNEEYLYALLIIPILLAIAGYGAYRRKKNLEKFGNMKTISELMPTYSVARFWVKFIFFTIAFALCVIVAARPQFGSKLEKVNRKGVEVMICMDVSNSMMCQDVAPSRLERSKQMIYKFVDGMENDKLGLIVFAGQAFTQLPITSDYGAAKMYASNINTNIMPTQGTAIGAAINLAVRSFSSKDNVGRSIIVITDGENHEDDAAGSAKEALEKGIQVNVIGIGKPEGAPIPDGHGSFIKDGEGNPVITRLNESLGGQIAAAGGGVYVRADNSNNALKYIQQELDKNAQGEVESKVYTDFDEQFPFFAWIALAVLVIEMIVMERKNKLLSKIKIF